MNSFLHQNTCDKTVKFTISNSSAIDVKFTLNTSDSLQ